MVQKTENGAVGLQSKEHPRTHEMAKELTHGVSDLAMEPAD
jgi:hypothetical protein